MDEQVVDPWRGQPSSEEKARERHASVFRQQVVQAHANEIERSASAIYAPCFGAAIEHLRNRIDGASVKSAPFPHLVVDDALPGDFFVLLRQAIPDRVFFDRLHATKYDLDLTTSFGVFRHLPLFQRAPWEFLLESLNRLVLVPALIQKFSAALKAKYDGLIGASEFDYATLNHRLMLRYPGYELRPHIDSARLGITVLLYLTGAAGEDERLGTDLYAGEAGVQTLATSTLYAHKANMRVEPAGTIAFKPNRIFAFPNLAYAFHGQLVPDDAAYEDGRIVFQFHIAPFEHQLQAAASRDAK
jgi:hypothetical protein